MKSDLAPKNCTVASYDIGFPLMPDIPGWEQVLDVMEAQYWPAFLQFTREVGFYRDTDVYTILSTALSSKDKRFDTVFDLVVFTPAGPAARYLPLVYHDYSIRFKRVFVPADPIVTQITRKIKGD